MKTIYKTDCGKHRSNNEDNVGVFHNDNATLAIVADGMGGEKAGEVASGMALDYFAKKWQTIDSEWNIQALEEWLQQCVIGANQSIYDYAREHPECDGMGTTVVAAICTQETVIIANVGDSRCYFMNPNGHLKQVTEDHTLVNQLLKAGQLSKSDAENHPMKHVIVRACGTEPEIEVDIDTLEWSSGDQVILCSDGLSDMLSEEEIAAIMNGEGNIEEKANQLIAQANHAGGNDNITLTIVVNDDGEDI
ncbi:MAG: Stp1/IreP family PP2C-type Ser/Thr phosphatase [Tuberibacillus sp.]